MFSITVHHPHPTPSLAAARTIVNIHLRSTNTAFVSTKILPGTKDSRPTTRKYRVIELYEYTKNFK